MTADHSLSIADLDAALGGPTREFIIAGKTIVLRPLTLEGFLGVMKLLGGTLPRLRELAQIDQSVFVGLFLRELGDVGAPLLALLSGLSKEVVNRLPMEVGVRLFEATLEVNNDAVREVVAAIPPLLARIPGVATPTSAPPSST